MQRSLEISRIKNEVVGSYAFPIILRGGLNGLVLVGTHKNGNLLRPDEVELLMKAVQQMGLNLQSLRVEALEREVKMHALRASELELHSKTIHELIRAELAQHVKGSLT